MRSKLFLLAASASLVLASHAAIDAGNGVKIVPNLIAGVDFNDNLFLTPTNEESETLYKLSPGILIASGDGALNTTTFSYNEEFQFFSNNSDLNTELALVDLISRYDDGKMKITLDAWYHEANQAQRDVRAIASLIKRDLVHGAISDEVVWSEKSSAKIGFTYDNTDYKPAGYADWNYYEVPLQYFYKVQPKLDASLGFTYKKNDVDRIGASSDEYFYNVGVRGEITPKFTGELQIGYTQFNPDSGRDQDGLGLKANFNFAVSPKTNLTLGAHSQYGYSSSGDSYLDEGVTGGFDAALTANFKLNGSAFWSNYDYSISSRKDDYYGAQIAGKYTFNEHAEVKASYTYSKNDSNFAGLSYNNSIIALSATLKY